MGKTLFVNGFSGGGICPGTDNFLRLKKYNKASIYIAIIVASFAISAGGELFHFHCFPQAFKAPSRRMEPTLPAGDSVFVDQSIFKRNSQRCDAMAFACPKDTSKAFIRRIVAAGQ